MVCLKSISMFDGRYVIVCDDVRCFVHKGTEFTECQGLDRRFQFVHKGTESIETKGLDQLFTTLVYMLKLDAKACDEHVDHGDRKHKHRSGEVQVVGDFGLMEVVLSVLLQNSQSFSCLRFGSFPQATIRLYLQHTRKRRR